MIGQQAAVGSVDILIAEDDALVRRTLRLLLEREGYRCSEAEDGGAAVELARRCPPRCVILDLAMPVLDGFAVARALRLNPRTRGVPIHCLTGRSDLSAREEATEAGIETYLTKPLNLSVLLQIVHRQLKQPQVLKASGLSLAEAREQLDCWEHSGYGGLEAAYQEGEGFTARCIRPPLHCEAR